MGVQKCCGQETCSEKDILPVTDRRCQLINEVKGIISAIEKEEKAKPQQIRRPDRGVCGMRDLEDECRQWRKRRECSPPLITTIALHETRPTSDYSNMRHENSSQVTYVDATKEGQEWRKVPPAPWDLPRSPSQELRAGDLYMNCRCLKRDGLQHDCPRWECAGRPECVAVNPGPCCIPSQWPKPIRGDRRYGNRTQGEASGATNLGGKPLKTGPLNPEICIPMGGPSPQGVPGGAGPEVVGFVIGGVLPQQRNVPVADAGSGCLQGNYPSHQQPRAVQTPRGQMEAVMVIEVGDAQPSCNVRPPQTPQMCQRPEASNMTLTGPGVICHCRPAQSASGCC